GQRRNTGGSDPGHGRRASLRFDAGGRRSRSRLSTRAEQSGRLPLVRQRRAGATQSGIFCECARVSDPRSGADSADGTSGAPLRGGTLPGGKNGGRYGPAIHGVDRAALAGNGRVFCAAKTDGGTRMKILITGGAGFIGSHLAERCLKQGWAVRVLDDLSTGAAENLAHLKDCPALEFAHGSVLDRRLLDQVIEGCDLVFHLAAAVGVRLILDNPVRAIATNIHGTEAVLAAAAPRRIPVFIASTSEVYGKSTALPFREDADLVLGATTKARWSYAASKALDEFLGMAYWSHSGVPVTIVRFFNTVGPRQTGRYGMVLPTFVKQALKGEPITVFGSGEQTRCFGYVGDVIEMLVRLAQTPRVAGEVINIGNDR